MDAIFLQAIADILGRAIARERAERELKDQEEYLRAVLEKFDRRYRSTRSRADGALRSGRCAS
jgi:GAF domain-containing protein